MPLRTSPTHRSAARPADPARPVAVSIWLVVLACLVPCTARGDGLPLAPDVSDAQSAPVVSPDGRGGAIVSYKTTSSRVGAVHVGPGGVSDGRLTFTPTPLPFELEDAQPLRVTATGDTALVIVADLASAGAPVATRLQNLGVPTAGQPISLAMPLRRPALVPGLGGRTLLVAMDADATSFWTLRIAVLDPVGTLESALELSSPRQFFYGDAIAACSDGAGGLLAAMPYYDAAITGSKDIGVFRYAADGSRPWGDTVRPLVIAARDQVDVQVVSDGAGGMIIAWTDPRVVSRSSDIYAHRVTASGQRSETWGFYGSPVCDATGPQIEPRMTSDGTGGAWIVWYDQRASIAGDLRYSHLLGSGAFAPGFSSSGTILCDAVGVQREAALAGDGAGGVFMVWRDERSGDADVYAQHILATGAVAPGWQANGRAVAVASGAQDQPAIAPVGAGRVVVAWRDARNGTPSIFSTALVDASVTGVPDARADGLRLSPTLAARGHAAVRVTLPSATAGVVELLDAAGRRLASERVAGPLQDREVRFEPTLSPGLYFARLRSAGAAVQTRLTVLR